MRNRRSSDARHVTRERLDLEASEGVSLGRGMLQRMLDWIRPAQRGRQAIEELVPPPFGNGKDFDPIALQEYLAKYAKVHASLMQGSGLVLGVAEARPDSPLPFKGDELPKLDETLSSGSFVISDFADKAAALDWAARFQSYEGNALLLAPQQVRWLETVALVRAAIDMAPFVSGRPRMKQDGTASPMLVEFGGRGDEHSTVAISALDNPMQLRKSVDSALIGKWMYVRKRATAAVIAEFRDALKSSGYPNEVADSVAERFRDAANYRLDTKEVGRLIFRLCSLTSVSEFVRETITGLDRRAVRAVMRHGTGRLTWRALGHYADPRLMSDIEAHESQGALALGHYSAESLAKLYEAHREDRAPDGYEGEFSRAFASELIRGLSGKSVELLRAVSPRYFAVAAFGHHGHRSLESYVLSEQQAVTDDLAQRAGRRLARSINQLVSESTTKQPLPWASLMGHRELYALLIHPGDDDEFAAHAKALMSVANAWRSSGLSQRTLQVLPLAEEVIGAPACNVVGSLLAIANPQSTAAVNSSKRMYATLARELIEEQGALTTEIDAGLADETFPSKIDWRLDYILPAVGDVYNDGEDFGNDLAFGSYAREFTLCFGANTTPPLHSSMVFTGAVVTPHSRRWLWGDDVLTVDDDAEDTYQLNVQPYPELRFAKLEKLTKKNAPFATPCVMEPYPHAAIKSPITLPSSSRGRADTRPARDHEKLLQGQLRDRIRSALAKRPFHVAALLPAVAKAMQSGGLLADLVQDKAPSAIHSLRLIKVGLHTSNVGLARLVGAQCARPAARSSAGHSMLDIALEAHGSTYAAALLEGLSQNPRIDAGGLAALVQSSIGKLVERQPKLLPQAVALGAVADDAALAAWNSLHPRRHSREAEAALNESMMKRAIERARGEPTEPAPASEQADAGAAPSPVRRRRMAV